jgi:hypothetical protein
MVTEGRESLSGGAELPCKGGSRRRQVSGLLAFALSRSRFRFAPGLRRSDGFLGHFWEMFEALAVLYRRVPAPLIPCSSR